MVLPLRSSLTAGLTWSFVATAVLWTAAEGPGRIAAAQNRAVNPQPLIEKRQNAARRR